MIELIALLLVLGVIAALVLPWVNLFRLSNLRADHERLRLEMQELKGSRGVECSNPATRKPEPVWAHTAAAGETPEPQEQSPATHRPPLGQKPSRLPRTTAHQAAEPRWPDALESAPLRARQEEPEPRDKEPAAVTTAEQEIDAQDWFSKAAIWVGGIALLMAGFYMIKYSIESGLLTPLVRLWITTGFGVLLCGTGLWIGIRSTQQANSRIGQALSGAGVACLYFAAYAAVHLYGLVPAGQGFAAMVAVTVLAVALSLKNGAPVAMLGLVGGFLTPWLMDTGSRDTVMLFSYLFVLFCGAQFLCLQRRWWGLLLGTILGAYLWSAVIIVGHLQGTVDQLKGTLVFVIAICLVNAAWVILAKNPNIGTKSAKVYAGVRWMTWCGGLAQGLALLIISEFAATDILLFSLLGVGALTLAVLREDTFMGVAWLALAAISIGVVSNPSITLWSWLLLPLGLAGLFFAVAHWRSFHSVRRRAWRSISLTASASVVPLLYLNRECFHSVQVAFEFPLWLGLSVAWMLLLAVAAEHVLRRGEGTNGAGEYSVAASIVLGFGLWTFLSSELHAHAAGLLLIFAALYWKWRDLGRAKLVISVFAAAWALSLISHALAATHYFFGKTMPGAPPQDALAVLAWGLGITGGAMVFHCYRKSWTEQAQEAVSWLTGIASLLGLIATYQWLSETQMPTKWPSSLIEGGLTALLAVAALIGALLAKQRPKFWTSCQLLAILIGVRVIYLHLLDTGAQGDSFFFNALLLQFGAPFILAWFLAFLSAKWRTESWRRIYQVAAMTLGFVWATFLVRDYFGNGSLFGSISSNTEFYTYSAVWLALARIYQVIGLIRQQAMLHFGSLLLLLVATAKVFLIDASQLEGLFRVISFLGLGLALIGIGYFYNKVVFARHSEQASRR